MKGSLKSFTKSLNIQVMMYLDNLEVTGHENQIDDSFNLANLVRRCSKIKSKRKLR